MLAAALGPAALVGAAAICIEERTLNPLFPQMRIGQYGLPIEVYKLLTLRRNMTAGEFRSYGIKDPRALRAGAILRRSCIDEVPQVYNVFIGDMSAVGPRPTVDKDRQAFKAAHPGLYSEWEEVCNPLKPGLTGISQLRKRNFSNHNDPAVYQQAMLDDIRYAELASRRLDELVIAKTPVQIVCSSLAALNVRVPDSINPFPANTNVPSHT
jgi:lipopolysaccharide/colanic/teichoic acid biosynthesis glycosyltransferase